MERESGAILGIRALSFRGSGGLWYLITPSFLRSCFHLCAIYPIGDDSALTVARQRPTPGHAPLWILWVRFVVHCPLGSDIQSLAAGGSRRDRRLRGERLPRAQEFGAFRRSAMRELGLQNLKAQNTLLSKKQGLRPLQRDRECQLFLRVYGATSPESTDHRNRGNPYYIKRGAVAQLVRAPACHAGGRRFEPVQRRHLKPA
jgi:hypothetical protein